MILKVTCQKELLQLLVRDDQVPGLVFKPCITVLMSHCYYSCTIIMLVHHRFFRILWTQYPNNLLANPGYYETKSPNLARDNSLIDVLNLSLFNGPKSNTLKIKSLPQVTEHPKCNDNLQVNNRQYLPLSNTGMY